MAIEVRVTKKFSEWLDDPPDGKAAALIAARIERLSYGHLGDVKVFEGIGELRIDHGPWVPCLFLSPRRKDLRSPLWWNEAIAGSRYQAGEEDG